MLDEFHYEIVDRKEKSVNGGGGNHFVHLMKQGKTATATVGVQFIGKWFFDKVAGALLVAAILFVVSKVASIGKPQIIHWLGGVTAEDIKGFVRFDQPLRIVTEHSDHRDKALSVGPSEVGAPGNYLVTPKYIPQDDKDAQSTRFKIEAWRVK